MEVVSLFNLTYAAKKGRINLKKPVSIKQMYNAGLMKKCDHGVRLIGRGSLKFKEYLESEGIKSVKIEASYADN